MIAILTASVPERGGMLTEAIASVAAQTVAPEAHYIGIDYYRRGPVSIYNQLAQDVGTEWMTFLDDDDLLEPFHLEALLEQRHDADVVYAPCHPNHHPGYQEPFSHDHLGDSSIVPITAMVRASFFHRVGGFQDEWGYDWKLWQRISQLGARFVRLDTPSWTYRTHVHPNHKNLSFGELVR